MQTISLENVVHLSNGEIEACLKNLNSQTRRTDIVRLVAFLLLNFSQIREYQNSHFGGTSTISKLTRSFRTMTFYHLLNILDENSARTCPRATLRNLFQRNIVKGRSTSRQSKTWNYPHLAV